MAWTDAQVSNFLNDVFYMHKTLKEINNQLKDVLIKMRIMNNPNPSLFGATKIIHKIEDEDDA